MKKFLLILIPLLFTSCFTTSHFDYASSLHKNAVTMMETSCGYTFISLIQIKDLNSSDIYYCIQAVDSNYSDYDKTLVYVTQKESSGISVYETIVGYARPYCNYYNMLQDYIDVCKSTAPNFFDDTKYLTYDNHDNKTHVVKLCVTVL